MSKSLRWWVDIANAPNVTVFRPIVDRLREDGHSFIFTVWDRGQARALAEAAWPETQLVGGRGYHMEASSKGRAIAERAWALRQAMRHERIDVALGHASNAQVVAARSLRITAVNMMDYEHHPANHVGFRAADIVALPAAIPYSAVEKFGVSRRRYMPYDCLKEELALATFAPAQNFRATIDVSEDELLAVVRPAAEGALYHRHQNSLFEEVVDKLVELGCLVILSPRTRSQGEKFEGRDRVRVMFEPVSGPDLLYCADVFVGGGGSMTREAAVLGTPTYSIFEGAPAAVDGALERQGRLVTLRDIKDLHAPVRKTSVAIGEAGVHERTADPAALDRFVTLLMSRVNPLVT